jgi:signal transduction histidine kinase
MSFFGTTGAKLTASYIVMFFVSMALLFGFSIFILDQALRSQIDLRLSAEMQDLVAEPVLRDAINERLNLKKGLNYRLTTKTGEVLAGNLGDVGTGEGFFNAGVPDNPQSEVSDTLRVLSKTVGDTTLLIATDTDEIENLQNTLLSVFGLTAVCASLLALFGGRWLSRFFMRRVDQLAGTAEAITKGDATRRMPLTKSGDEFDRLSLSLNTMLDRNAALMESQRQITNDIAHDLRTPLTRLRQKLEQRPNDDALADTDELLATMNALLRIAEIEEGDRKKHFTKVDLGDIVRTVADAYAGAIEDQDKSLTVAVASAAMIDGDKALLTQMLSNLIENIIAHTPTGTVAEVSVTNDSSSVHLQVSDNGPGVSATETEKISRRFYRAEKSRNTPGNGLGLSLVKAIAELHGAEMEVQNLEPGLFISFDFPEVNAKPANN